MRIWNWFTPWFHSLLWKEKQSQILQHTKQHLIEHLSPGTHPEHRQYIKHLHGRVRALTPRFSIARRAPLRKCVLVVTAQHSHVTGSSHSSPPFHHPLPPHHPRFVVLNVGQISIYNSVPHARIVPFRRRRRPPCSLQKLVSLSRERERKLWENSIVPVCEKLLPLSLSLRRHC